MKSNLRPTVHTLNKYRNQEDLQWWLLCIVILVKSRHFLEQQTVTKSGLFAFLGSSLPIFFQQITSTREKTLRNTVEVASRQIKRQKSSLLIDVHHSTNCLFLSSLLSVVKGEGTAISLKWSMSRKRLAIGRIKEMPSPSVIFRAYKVLFQPLKLNQWHPAMQMSTLWADLFLLWFISE